MLPLCASSQMYLGQECLSCPVLPRLCLATCLGALYGRAFWRTNKRTAGHGKKWLDAHGKEKFHCFSGSFFLAKTLTSAKSLFGRFSSLVPPSVFTTPRKQSAFRFSHLIPTRSPLSAQYPGLKFLSSFSFLRMGIGGSRAAFAPDQIPVSFSTITFNDIYGVQRSLGEWDGKVKIVVNVASNCGLTKAHNKEFIELREKIGTDAFEILAFPSRQFANQEFADIAETQQFCERVKIPFPVFTTSDVNGPETNPVFLYCKWNSDSFYHPVKNSRSAKLSDIGWNYGKFLVDKDNGVYKYYGPRTKPLEMEEDIRKLIAGQAKGMKRNAAGELKPL
uniref:Glutathione peroxidase n=1 Tax=Toxoplasma gondii COUG TaxID=1074873 RepID=A0A2G8Y3Y5_TOXGO|nr:thioredoxin-dependent peroxidase TPX1/2 [Toxoplasma gondii COUG]